MIILVSASRLCYRRPLNFFKAHQYDIIVVDESFQQVEAGAESLVASHAGKAMPVYFNLSLHGTDRVAKEVNRALQRLTTRGWRRCARRRACCATSYPAAGHFRATGRTPSKSVATAPG
jgi:hypothetical protein